jgi:hypothetical protein
MAIQEPYDDIPEIPSYLLEPSVLYRNHTFETLFIKFGWLTYSIQEASNITKPGRFSPE